MGRGRWRTAGEIKEAEGDRARERGHVSQHTTGDTNGAAVQQCSSSTAVQMINYSTAAVQQYSSTHVELRFS